MDQPNFYAIIPASVRYDKRLKPNEKLLYGEITSLANSKGYCFASNSYFAELYDVSSETISRWISHLGKLGYINPVVMTSSGNKRKIYIAEMPIIVDDVLTEKSIPIDKNVNTPIDKNVKHNNTSINNINNIFDFWNSKNIIIHRKISVEFEKAITVAIKKFGIENITAAIERYSQAYFDSRFYYNHKWNLLNFLKQGNGISNWLDDGQLWNNYMPSNFNKPQGASSPSAVPGADQTDEYLEKIQKMRGGGLSG